MKLRPLTIPESIQLARLGMQIERDVDIELGHAILRIAGGDDSSFPKVHDRANVIGRFDIADRVRALVSEEIR